MQSTGLLRRWLGAQDRSALELSDVLWFFGAIAAVVASLAIIGKIPESHRDVWVFLASVGFLAAYALAGLLLTSRGQQVPGGLAAGMAAAIVPAVGYGFSQLVHAYPRQAFFDPFEDFSGAVFGIALATAAAAVLAFAFTRVTLVLALAVGAVTVAAQLLATTWHPSFDGRATVGLVVGGLFVLTGLGLDAIGRRREAFWPYLGGLGAVGAALVVFAFPSGHLDVWIALLVLGALLLLFFAPVGRRTWAVFGAAYVTAAFALSQASPDGRGGRAVWVGAVLVAVGLALDAIGRRQVAFWIYPGGLAGIGAGLALLAFPGGHLDVWIALLALGALLLLFFAPVGRSTWAVFGAAYVATAFAFSQVQADGRAGRAMWVGAVLVAVGLILDRDDRRAVGFWLHIGGLAALGEGLAYFAITSPNSEPWIPLLVIGAVLLLLFAPYGRRTWAVFGAAYTAGAYAACGLATGDGRAARVLVVSGTLVAVGLILDALGRRPVGFWIQLAGLTGAAAALVDLALTSAHPETRAWVPMVLVAAVLLLASPVLGRRLWAVFGAAGLATAFGHYLDTQSGWFSYALLAIAVAAFSAGLVVHRREGAGRSQPPLAEPELPPAQPEPL